MLSGHHALIPLWRLSGWLLGALPSLFGRRAVFVTIAAVETFVETHYEDQIIALAGEPRWAGLRSRLQAFCTDEVAHRDDAADRLTGDDSLVTLIWSRIIDIGSRAGVLVARLV